MNGRTAEGAETNEMLRTRRLLGNKTLIQIAHIVAFLVGWEIIARMRVFPELIFPSPLAVAYAYAAGWSELLHKTLISMEYITGGLLIGIGIATALTILGTYIKPVDYVTSFFNAVLHPLPSIALLPILLIWFGANPTTLVVIIVLAAIWPFYLNLDVGFRSISRIYSDVGRNIGLKKIKTVVYILIPASLPYMLSGVKSSWARSWRAAIAVEMVYGAAAGQGGIGWYIYMARFLVNYADVIAGTIVISVISVLIERLFFERVERQTVLRWGMTV